MGGESDEKLVHDVGPYGFSQRCLFSSNSQICNNVLKTERTPKSRKLSPFMQTFEIVIAYFAGICIYCVRVRVLCAFAVGVCRVRVPCVCAVCIGSSDLDNIFRHNCPLTILKKHNKKRTLSVAHPALPAAGARRTFWLSSRSHAHVCKCTRMHMYVILFQERAGSGNIQLTSSLSINCERLLVSKYRVMTSLEWTQSVPFSVYPTI